MTALALALVLATALGGCASAPSTPAAPVPAAPEHVEQTATPRAPSEAALKPFVEVSVEVYNRTFDEIGEVIQELNTRIAKRDYEAWLGHLTERYIRETSRPEYLERWKDDPQLRRRGVVLKNLRDFFEYLVVPTRSNVKLDEIQFVDDTHVYAFTILKGEKYLLYYLVKTDDGWKVDFY